MNIQEITDILWCNILHYQEKHPHNGAEEVLGLVCYVAMCRRNSGHMSKKDFLAVMEEIAVQATASGDVFPNVNTAPWGSFCNDHMEVQEEIQQCKGTFKDVCMKFWQYFEQYAD